MSQRYQASNSVVGETLDGEIVLLDLQTGRYFQLNASASRMWEAIATSGDADSALATLTGEFDVAEEELRRDLRALIDTLLQRGLLVPTP